MARSGAACWEFLPRTSFRRFRPSCGGYLTVVTTLSLAVLFLSDMMNICEDFTQTRNTGVAGLEDALTNPVISTLGLSPKIDSAAKCKTAPEITVDPFPPNFDAEIFKQNNGPEEQAQYDSGVRDQGWMVSSGQMLRDVLNKDILPSLHADALEIGPFLRPIIHGEHVKYFDVLDLEHLKARAAAIGYPAEREVEIDYVEPTGDLTRIPDKHKFGLVVGSHMLEHQLDLVRHIQVVADLLLPGGYYAFIVPDKRYCFDYFVSESSIADYLDDYRSNRYFSKRHSLRSIIEHRVLITHNYPVEHWAGNHGANTLIKDHTEQTLAAVKEYEAALHNGAYIDVHNYQFTPYGLATALEGLYNLGLITLKVHRVYPTLKNQLEFSIVLRADC